MDITIEQIKAARGALNWSAAKLAEESGLSLRTVQNLEAAHSDVTVRKSSLLAIKAVFESAGIEFIGTPDDAPGIRIHRK
jgi:transcriptional regulator with XRE-family HTH domain